MSTNDHNSSMLVLFARYPEKGTGKRRIARDLGDAHTHLVAKHLYVNGWSDLLRWPGPTAVSTTRPHYLEDDGPFPAKRIDDFVIQTGDNLGQRIQDTENKLRRKHNGPLIFIGSDSPELKQEHFEQASHLLETHDVVLGPAMDGGVTLMGVRDHWPPLDDLPWSTDRLFTELRQRCRDHMLSVALLEPTHDTDDVYDLLRIRQSLEKDWRPDRRNLHTLMTRMFPSVGVVIPAKNDALQVATLLQQLEMQGVDRVIVVDAEHDPLTAQRCYRHGATYLEGGSSRGERMDIGAGHLRTEVLWFLHADTRLPDGAADELRLHIVRGNSGGWFRFRFDGKPGRGKSLLERCINWRARLGTPYGDQGLFVSRTAYHETGGLTHQPLFEEVRMVRRLRRQDFKFAPVKLSIGVSERRWQQDGWIRRTLSNRWLALQYMCGVKPERLAARYHGKRPDKSEPS